jgi:cytochrome P450
MTVALKTVADLPTIQFPETYTRDKLCFLARMAREHGPIFRHDWPDGGRVVFMVGPDANKFVMQTHREYFSHDLGWTPHIGEIMGKGLLNMDPPEHDRHRKMMNPAFTMAYMSRYLPIMNRVIAERSRDWAARDAVDLYEEARKITFDVAAETLVGFKAGPMVDYLRDMFYALLHAGEGANITSEEEWLAHVLPIRDQLQAALSQLINERRGIPENDRSDILAMMVNARDENGNALSDEQLLAHVNILLVAGHETSTTMASWLLYLLATHPDQLQEVRAEIDRVPGAGGEVTMEAIRAMRTLGYAVQEAGRIAPPVAMVPRGVLSDVEFGDYLLPAGTYVLLAIGAPHWEPAFFAEPERFDLHRFAPPREEDKRTPYALATFGGGPRICIGVNFAQVEVKAMAAHVLRQYDLEPVAPEETVQIYPGLLGQPEHGIRVRVRSRHAM